MADDSTKDRLDTFHRALISAAVLAPTPDNNQPWLFETDGDALRVSIDPRRTLPSDVQGMFDLLGIGAAVENICIAAREHGFEPHVQIPMEAETSDSPQLVATLTFTPGAKPDPLYPRLESRCTNRKLYAKRATDEAVLNRLTQATDAFRSVQVAWIPDRARIKVMARLIASTDLIRFQYEPFHAELFRQLRFRPDEAERTRDGLDVRTLELPPGIPLVLRSLRSWSVMSWLHRLGLGRLLALPSGLAVRNSGALGVISCQEASRACFLEGGRALERLWLQADKEGLALQPLGSPAIFFAHQQLLGGSQLTKEHGRIIRQWIELFRELVPEASDRRLLMMVRIGKASPPRHRSARLSVDEVVKRS